MRTSCDNGNAMRLTWLLPLTFGWLTAGCQWFGGVRIENIATASSKPSNVAAIVSVTKKDAPVAELDVSSFRILEDGKVLDPKISDVRLLDPATVAAFHTVLLVDLGHAKTDEKKRQLSKAVATFVRKTRQRQPVTVLVFDGSARTRMVGDFSVEPNGSGPEILENLLLMVPADPSRNLRGAIIDGLDALDARLERSPRPVRVGTLVVFSRGPDVAGRVKESEYEDRVSQTQHQFVYVDITGDPGDGATKKLGKKTHISSQDETTLPIAFEEAGMVTARLNKQYYLISYCSPARAGKRQLRVEVTVPSIENEPETDAFETDFDAEGFAPGCNSNNPPKFTVLKPTTDKPSSTVKTGTPGKPEAPPDSATTNSATPHDDRTNTNDDDDNEVPPPNTPGYAP
jgi:hypothetical protein